MKSAIIRRLVKGVGCLLLFGCIDLFCWNVGRCEQEQYPWGRDTIERFGNGRFQILSFADGPGLMDGQTQENIVYLLNDWRAQGDWVYAVGTASEYTVLNYRTGFHQHFKVIDEAPPKYKKELVKLRVPKR